MNGNDLRSVRRAFREWRRERPFWSGVLFVIAGVVIGYGPAQMAVQFALLPGNVAVLGLGIGAFVFLCGVFSLAKPELAGIFGTVGIVLSILALFGGALGGYLVGTLLGVLAGSLSVAWQPPAAGHQDRSPSSASSEAPADEPGSIVGGSAARTTDRSSDGRTDEPTPGTDAISDGGRTEIRTGDAVGSKTRTAGTNRDQATSREYMAPDNVRNSARQSENKTDS